MRWGYTSILLIAAALPAEARQFDLIPPTDKQLHFLASYALTMSCHEMLKDQPSWACPLFVFGIGVIKEIGIDPLRGGRTELNDVFANSLGIGLAWAWRF